MANNFKNYTLKSVGTSAANVYAVGAGVQATVIGMSIANMITTPISASITLNGGTITSNVFMIKDATIAPGGALIPIGGDQKFVLEAGDYLQVNTSIASSADVIVSVLEIS
jgi:hypothetical protein